MQNVFSAHFSTECLWISYSSMHELLLKDEAVKTITDHKPMTHQFCFICIVPVFQHHTNSLCLCHSKCRLLLQFLMNKRKTKSHSCSQEYFNYVLITNVLSINWNIQKQQRAAYIVLIFQSRMSIRMFMKTNQACGTGSYSLDSGSGDSLLHEIQKKIF